MNLVFIGSQPIGHKCLNEVIKLGIKVIGVFTFKPDKHEKWEKSVDEIAVKNNIPLYFSEELTVDKIKSLNPDLILVVGYRKIFSNEILKIPRLGVIGLHASLLPHLRGQAPLNWSIIIGDEKAGITMFFMDEGTDTGDIIGQKATEISIGDTIIDIKQKVEGLAVKLISENLLDVFNGKNKRIKQPEKGTYGCARIPDDGKINWNWSALKIYNLIRSCEPSYPAFTFFNSKKLYITKAELIQDSTYFGTPGQVGIVLRSGSVIVTTGDGSLKVHKVKFDGESEIEASKVLNSNKIRLH